MLTPSTPITIEVPVVAAPATAVKTFPNLWLRRLELVSPGATTVRADAVLSPYNAATGEFAPPQNDVRIIVPNLFAPAAFTPRVQAAMAALLDAIQEAGTAQGKIR